MANTAIDKFNALMQEYVDKSYDELFQIADSAMNDAMNHFNGIAKDGNGAPYVVLFISTILAMDGKFTELEYKFLNDLLGGGVNYESAKANVQSHYNDEAFDIADKIIDSCDSDMKTTLLVLVSCFAAVDHKISVEEARYIAKLLME